VWFARDAAGDDLVDHADTAVGVPAAEADGDRAAEQLDGSASSNVCKEIARELQISPWTVQDHVKAVYAKTGVTCRGDLSAMVFGP
jgi:hypothetical protein